MVVKTPAKQGKTRTPQDVDKLKDLKRHNTPTPLIGYKLGRSPAAVQQKAQELNISLKPTNKSPYGTAGNRGVKRK